MMSKGKTLFMVCLFYVHQSSLIYCYIAYPVSLADQSTFSHNSVRDLHNVKQLVWDVKLAASSQEYSKELAKDNSLHHSQQSKDGAYGENLYKAFSGFLETKKVSDAVFNWYLEGNHYDYENPKPDLELYGHFTSVVWKDTSHFGCGYSTRFLYGGLMTYIVCHYQVQGNVEGFFLSQVPVLREGAQLPTHPQQLEVKIGCLDYYEQCTFWLGVCKQQILRSLMFTYCKKSCGIC